jgi:hypothetical protein
LPIDVPAYTGISRNSPHAENGEEEEEEEEETLYISASVIVSYVI